MERMDIGEVWFKQAKRWIPVLYWGEQRAANGQVYEEGLLNDGSIVVVRAGLIAMRCAVGSRGYEVARESLFPTLKEAA